MGSLEQGWGGWFHLVHCMSNLNSDCHASFSLTQRYTIDGILQDELLARSKHLIYLWVGNGNKRTCCCCCFIRNSHCDHSQKECDITYYTIHWIKKACWIRESKKKKRDCLISKLSKNKMYRKSRGCFSMYKLHHHNLWEKGGCRFVVVECICMYVCSQRCVSKPFECWKGIY